VIEKKFFLQPLDVIRSDAMFVRQWSPLLKKYDQEKIAAVHAVQNPGRAGGFQAK
jgi:hypothetical protein